jgi:hypothetical protein
MITDLDFDDVLAFGAIGSFICIVLIHAAYFAGVL